MASQSLNIYSPLTRQVKGDLLRVFSKALVPSDRRQKLGRIILSRGKVICSAVQESSAAATVTDKKEAEPAAKAEAEAEAPAVKKAPQRPKKPAAKPLPQLMEEDLIPSLKAALETQEDVSQIELSFGDNKLEGSFLKKDIPYNFWAFFPSGDLTGPKAFSLSSYGYEASTVEPFLIDERRVTAELVVFWIRKRLVAQGILPVWKE